ncbi:FAD-dependent monooxygenase [Arthrobacter ginkgonis]|uniref:FAD-dependent monooxygenase n=1 Tax=Arthrobacter ginkgonis TaxID=1630594 RepID=A0ABP7CT01_9MICC
MRALVIGAGIAGLAAAGALARGGWEVEILEARTQRPEHQGMADLFGAGYDALEAIGLLPAASARSSTPFRIELQHPDGRPGPGYPTARFYGAFGGRHLSLPAADLEALLEDALPPTVRLRRGCAPERLEADDGGTAAWLPDGGCVRADVLVGADGLGSAVRRTFFGPDAECVRDLGLRVADVSVHAPGLVQELRGRGLVADGIGRTVQLCGLPDGRAMGAFIEHSAAAARPGRPDTDAGTFLDAFTGLAPATDSLLGLLQKSPALHQPAVPDSTAPDPTALGPASAGEPEAVAAAVVELPRWSTGRVVLIGDAACAVSFVSSQEAGLALAGGAFLGAALARTRAPEQVPGALAEFERRWRPTVRGPQRLVKRYAHKAVPRTRMNLLDRRFALRVLSVPGIARASARQLLGPIRGPVN